MKRFISRKLAASVLISFATSALFAQTISAKRITELASEMTFTDKLVAGEAGTSGKARTLAANPQIAMSSIDYPVTAGDVYTLAFASGSTNVSYTVSVDSTYKFRVANLAVLNVAGLTFVQLKKQVEDIVSKNYPLSGVQLVLISPAVFQVTVEGEVQQTEIRQAWAMTRLSSIIDGVLTDYSSTRDIVITSSSGKETVYDLFKASRDGDLSQDPYVRPGDTITVNRVSRKVSIKGAVERPGSYELLKNETLKDLIDVYGGGFTDYADKNRIQLSRYDLATRNTSVFYITEKQIEENLELLNHDVVSVVTTSDLRPVMFIEGAVAEPGKITEVSSVAEMDRITVRYDYETNYAYLVRNYEKYFRSTSDLSHAYIIREDQIIHLDINRILYDKEYQVDITVQPYDTLRIPFRLYYVTVSGAVANPGRYPYVPDRDWEYYIGLAGGFDEGRNISGAVKITDAKGKRHKISDPITPETTITARTNRMSYQINRNVTPWLTIISTFVSSILSIVSISKLFNP